MHSLAVGKASLLNTAATGDDTNVGLVTFRMSSFVTFPVGTSFLRSKNGVTA